MSRAATAIIPPPRPPVPLVLEQLWSRLTDEQRQQTLTTLATGWASAGIRKKKGGSAVIGGRTSILLYPCLLRRVGRRWQAEHLSAGNVARPRVTAAAGLFEWLLSSRKVNLVVTVK
jgi:hypothetical protein